MQNIIIQIINQWGYIGVLMLIAIENIFPPIPSEIILTFSGFLTMHTKMNIIGVIIAATIGSLLGAIILYLIGRLLSKEKIEKIVDGKIGKILRLKKENIEKTYSWFEQKGENAVLFCRCIPILRSLISVPAGMTKMKIPQFVFLTTIGTIVWNTVLVYLGAKAGESWDSIVKIFEEYSSIVKIMLLVIVVGYVLKKTKKKIIVVKIRNIKQKERKIMKDK